MAEGLGFEPSHNGFRDRRATATLALNMRGTHDGIRTHTEGIFVLLYVTIAARTRCSLDCVLTISLT